MSAKNNYKAKWLKAINESNETLADRVTETERNITEANAAHVNTASTIKRIRDPLLESAANARDLIVLMDECRKVGTHEFNETFLPLDKKLSNMDLVTIARRTRDALKLATVRIGIMSAALDEAYETIDKLQDVVVTLKPFAEETAKTVTELFVVGRDPTERELMDVEKIYSEGDREYMRYNEAYEDLGDDNWELTPLSNGAALRTHRIVDQHDADSDDDDDDGDDDDDEDNDTIEVKTHERKDSGFALTHSRNRSAQVVTLNNTQSLEDELSMT